MTNIDININDFHNLCIKAWNEILKIYNTDFEIKYKVEEGFKSPLTQADLNSNKVIIDFLENNFDYPIISEENKEINYETRKNYKYFWLVDPLDWTKEFIKKNGEFTVNIALIHDNNPIFWMIYVPVTNICYYAIKWQWSYEIKNKVIKKLKGSIEKDNIVKIVASRSHVWDKMEKYIKNIEKSWKIIEYIS